MENSLCWPLSTSEPNLQGPSRMRLFWKIRISDLLTNIYVSKYKAPVRVENPIDHFPVDNIRPNHCLVDGVRVFLPLADGHLKRSMIKLEAIETSSTLSDSIIVSPSPSCDWTHAPTSRSSCRCRGGEEGPRTTLKVIFCLCICIQGLAHWYTVVQSSRSKLAIYFLSHDD